MGKWIKSLGVLVIVAMLATPVFATQRRTVLADEVEISATTTDTGYKSHATGNSEKITFFVTLDSSSTTSSVTAQVKPQVSVDGENWTDVSWFDLAGGSTLQTSQTIGSTGDETYVMWLDENMLAPHVRIKVYQEGNWDTQTGDITITLVEQK